MSQTLSNVPSREKSSPVKIHCFRSVVCLPLDVMDGLERRGTVLPIYNKGSASN